MKSTIINSQEKYRGISIILNFIWAILLLSTIIDYFLNYDILRGASILLASSLILSFFEIKFITKITDYKIEQGYKVGFIQKLLKSKEIQKGDFANIEILQDSEKYFQIIATDVKGNKMLLNRQPNLNPAKAELERIESLLESQWAIKLPTAI